MRVRNLHCMRGESSNVCRFHFSKTVLWFLTSEWLSRHGLWIRGWKRLLIPVAFCYVRVQHHKFWTSAVHLSPCQLLSNFRHDSVSEKVIFACTRQHHVVEFAAICKLVYSTRNTPVHYNKPQINSASSTQATMHQKKGTFFWCPWRPPHRISRVSSV